MLLAMGLALVLSLSVNAHAESMVSTSPDDGGAIDTPLVRQSVIDMIDRLDDGRYDGISTRREFADQIGAELREISGDGHLGIMLAVADEAPTHVITETVDRFRLNYAFQKVEILEGNIGYLKFNKFYLDDEAQATADHALGFVSGTDALIIDLTECVGGSPELVRHIASYFFADETVLWSIIDRDGKSVHDAISTSGLGPARFKQDFPLYILTSPETASGAELFAYTLRSFDKAKTVGQGTMGVAHLVGALPINEHFVGRFSTYRNANALTNSNWEGVGVAPDTAVALEDSLAVAVRLATGSMESK
jgi:C-terminal processing protease CtpA/Prc